MLYTGLVSVTFRKLSPAEVVELVAKAGLNGIEWGGDIHVPHGDIKRAEEVRKMTENAGLKVAAYGSYYRVGTHDDTPDLFESVLETAVELKAPTIRVWAGDKGSAEADGAWWDKVVCESRRIAGMAAEKGISISFEYHDETLTDTSESACRFLKEINHPNIKSLWQPPTRLSLEDRYKGLEKITPWLTNVHVFNWTPNSTGWFDTHALAGSEAEWSRYIDYANKLQGDRYFMLEFVKDGTPEQFLQDAEVLKQMMKNK